MDGVKKEAAQNPGIKIVGTFHHLGNARDAAAEVVSAQKANPQIQGWAMIGGWPLFTPRLMTELDPQKVKIVAVDALPAQLVYVDKGLAPVLLAQPTYNWGYVSVQRIFDKVHLKQDVPDDPPADGCGTRHEGQPRNVGAPIEGLGVHGPECVPEAQIGRTDRFSGTTSAPPRTNTAASCPTCDRQGFPGFRP